MQEAHKEKLSLLVDDQLDEQQAYQLLKSLQHNQAMQAKLKRYHLIQQAMKNERCLTASDDFVDKMHQRLREEPTILAPRRKHTVEWQKTARLALAASVALVAVIVLGSLDKFMQPMSGADRMASLEQNQELSENARFKAYLAEHDNVWYANQNLGGQQYARLTGSQPK